MGEGDLDRLARGQFDLGAGLGGTEEGDEGVVRVGALDVVVVRRAVDDQLEGAESLDAEGVGAALARGEGARQLDGVQPLVGDALGEVRTHPLDLAAGHGGRADDVAVRLPADRFEAEPLVGGGEFGVGVGADGVAEGALGEGGGEAVERGDDPVREDGGGAAAEDTGVAGGGADEGDRAGLQRERTLVADQHEGAAGDLAGQFDAVDGLRKLGDDGFGTVQDADAGGEPQHIAYGGVDRALLDLPVPHGLGEGLAVDGRRAGHGDVEAALDGGLGGAGGHPVGDVVAVESPFAAQDFVDQVVVLGHRRAVDRVVGGHDAPRVGVLDDELEGRQVQLAQGAFGDQVVHREAVGLGVVGDEVLDGGADTALLYAGDVPGADPSGQVRVLAVGLEVAAAERGAVEVDGGGEEDVDALAAGLLGEQHACAAGEFRVPGGGQGGRGGQGDRRVVGAPAHAPDTDRAVRHDEGVQADLGERGQGPHVLA